jgi:subtilisin family serine protease
MADGVDYASKHGAGVICIAQSAPSSPSLTEAIFRAEALGSVVVAAAGNRDRGELSVVAPANIPGVVAVASVNKAGNHYDDSTAGPEVVVSAPGVDILSPLPGGKYGQGTGTSDAAAIVAGAVALVRAKYPNLSAAEVIHRLTATATDKGPPGRDNEYGYGVINIVAALTADVPPLSASPRPAPSGVDHSPDRSSAVAQPPSAPSDGPSALLIVIPAAVFLCALVGTLVWWAARRRTP